MGRALGEEIRVGQIMMGDQRPSERPDILERLRAAPFDGFAAYSLQEAIEEIESLRLRLAASDAALGIATTDLNRLGAEVAVLRASRRDREARR